MLFSFLRKALLMAYRPYFRASSRFEYPRRSKFDQVFFLTAVVLGLILLFLVPDRGATVNPLQPTSTQNAK